MAERAKISQKEYLKRYLGNVGEDKEKKARKKEKLKKVKGRNVIIVDDDLNLPTFNQFDDEKDVESFNAMEDAPQIAGIIDERPPELQALDYKKNGKWRMLGDKEVTVVGKSTIEGDLSPRRRMPRIENTGRRAEREQSADLSPPRSKSIKREIHTPDLSPPRVKRERSSKISDLSPRRKHRNDSDSDLSPPRPTIKSGTKSSLPKRNKQDEKMSKTLDGKRAGLQDAASLRKESDQHRRRERDMFEKMSAEDSGRYAEAKVRKTAAGHSRDLEEQARREQEKIEKEKERKAVYDRWGKGLKQVEDYRSKLESDLHEANKPLARYADDTDLDQMLRAQERLGDPMLDYIRSKKKEKRREERQPERPMYQGLFPDNRFNIRPGYRWDGVDRSNGFEKKYFENINLKKAGMEEAYRYSTEDM